MLVVVVGAKGSVTVVVGVAAIVVVATGSDVTGDEAGTNFVRAS